MPHDVNGMVQLFGGREEFVSALDRLFTLESPDEDMGLCDITGLKGQYAHGNEPSHHMAYLYDWVGQPWKTQELTRTLLDEMYAPTPAGIIGNEDCGQMSAWYVFSALGFYPVCPGSNEYALTAPLFERAEVRLANGRTLTVTADNPRRNRYVWEVTFNGVPVKENFIDAERLHEGGELHFALRPSPERSRGTAAEAAPYSLTQGNRVSVPYTTADLSLFTEPVEVELATATAGAEIRYTLDGSEPDESSALYAGPLCIDRSLTLRARGFMEGAAPSPLLSIEAERACFLRPLESAGTVQGVRYTCYEGAFSRVADIVGGRRAAEGTMSEPSIAAAPQPDHFGYVFEGVIRIPERGVWEFMTRSDDGSVLFVGGRKGHLHRFAEETARRGDAGHRHVAAVAVAGRKGLGYELAHAFAGQLHAQEAAHRGGDVADQQRGFDHLARRDAPAVEDHRRGALESRVAAVRIVQTAVVGRDDEHRIVGHALGVETRDQLADHRIEARDRMVILLRLVAVGVARMVGLIDRDEEEVGFVVEKSVECGPHELLVGQPRDHRVGHREVVHAALAGPFEESVDRRFGTLLPNVVEDRGKQSEPVSEAGLDRDVVALPVVVRDAVVEGQRAADHRHPVLAARRGAHAPRVHRHGAVLDQVVERGRFGALDAVGAHGVAPDENHVRGTRRFAAGAPRGEKYEQRQNNAVHGRQ